MEIVGSIPKLKPRAVEAHKGDFGKVLIIAGSVGMSGAAALAGRAALRAGAGLVRVATPKSILPIIASIEPSFTTIALPEDGLGRISAKAINIILDAAGENDAVAFGPGIGVSGALQSILKALLAQPQLRLLIDADGLNNLARRKDWPAKRKAQLILTPHPGEMKRLWSGLFRQEPPPSRQEQAMMFAQRSTSIVVLKGAGTVVTDGDRVYINQTGNPGMATGGTGDVLTGVVTALMGQGLSDFDAAVLGVYIHGLAGDIAAERLGQVSLMATDVIDSLSDAFMRS
ncbi:MAG: NAD(P)H-hydrate dehydratase [Planctomycetes bacterium RBG_16_55_9]|nr:MAG: NAD(P)H-hydrate dehydratase [Planctomycetes bacterium RBG_16_55_9]